MKEQFVTYEIALKLKELGFNEPCLGIFDFTKEVYTGSKPEHFDSQEKVQYIFGNEKNQVILAPLWQQAIDFLKTRKVLVAEILDGWEYGAYEWDDFIYTDTKEEAILKAIELCQGTSN